MTMLFHNVSNGITTPLKNSGSEMICRPNVSKCSTYIPCTTMPQDKFVLLVQQYDQ